LFLISYPDFPVSTVYGPRNPASGRPLLAYPGLRFRNPNTPVQVASRTIPI